MSQKNPLRMRQQFGNPEVTRVRKCGSRRNILHSEFLKSKFRFRDGIQSRCPLANSLEAMKQSPILNRYWKTCKPTGLSSLGILGDAASFLEFSKVLFPSTTVPSLSASVSFSSHSSDEGLRKNEDLLSGGETDMLMFPELRNCSAQEEGSWLRWPRMDILMWSVLLDLGDVAPSALVNTIVGLIRLSKSVSDVDRLVLGLTFIFEDPRPPLNLGGVNESPPSNLDNVII
ncbi:hypothetical protein NQ318_004821 [Aromia moschata]|uniref:Uncharacterized protein n=1 Tax=Aromia moschata TaxID=1265417 RepID=A0AAV8Z0K8_9CUCU|nr:hypothetical protein NQ318_004821 [Aromia moschata]